MSGPTDVKPEAPTPKEQATAAAGAVRADVGAGLTKVMADTPVAHGYAEVIGGWAPASGLFARGEAGYHPLPNLGLFGFGEVGQITGAQAGIGARVTF